MTVLHTVCLVAAVFIPGVSGFLNPAFTAGFSNNYYTPSQTVPVLFDKIITNVGNMYNATTGTATIPMDGIYWVTINVQPAPGNESQLVLTISGSTTKLRTWVQGFQVSRSAGFRLKQGNQLTVMAEVIAALANYTFWSVAYIGNGAKVFSAWVDPDRKPGTPVVIVDYTGGQIQETLSRFKRYSFSGGRERENPVPFPDWITVDKPSITQDALGVFTVPVDSLYLVHLSAYGDRHLILALQILTASMPNEEYIWKDLLVVGAQDNDRPSSLDIVLKFGKGTRLRVFRRQNAYPGKMTLFSIVSIGSPASANTTAVTVETKPNGTLGWYYRSPDPVRFGKVYINTNHIYNLTTHTYTVPFDSVYIVSLRPYTRPTIILANWRKFIWPCCYPLIFDLKNGTHVQLSALVDTFTPSGYSAAIYLQAGDQLNVFPRNPLGKDSNVWYGSVFSIANLHRCCDSPGS